ncbi:MAG: hypothetical protein ACM3US_09940 [Sphingomonadaceae bacterium]
MTDQHKPSSREIAEGVAAEIAEELRRAAAKNGRTLEAERRAATRVPGGGGVDP